jgi:hypothetical protein
MTTKVRLVLKNHLNDLILEMGSNEKITDIQIQKLKMIKTLIEVYMPSDARIEDKKLDILFNNH